MKSTKSFNVIAIAASCILTTSIFTAPITHAKSPNKPGRHSGLIKANKHIVKERAQNNLSNF